VKGNTYTIGFAAVLGCVCALLLTAAASFTKPYKQANQKAEEALNILKALKVPLPQDVSSMEVVEIREKNVQEKEMDGLTSYVYSPPEADGKVLGVAVRFAGPGLWGPVKGCLALEPDMKTIRGMTIYEQKETPGLGGEIVAPWFRDQFVDKSIVDAAGNPGIIISMSSEQAPNKVDGISGATMTCDKLQAMLNEAIRRIVEEK
jgi:Na+-transporting NADH:ubiquinone oxidoreductase subunit C